MNRAHATPRAAPEPLMPAKTRVFVDFVAEAFKRQRLDEKFAGSLP